MRALNFWLKTFPSRDIKYQCDKNMNFTIPSVYAHAQTHPAISGNNLAYGILVFKSWNFGVYP